jgi:hypothetical protein
MRRGADGDTWRTSFPSSLPGGVSDVIDTLHSVLTVLSGSVAPGGHVSMFLERLVHGLPVCEMIDLSVGNQGIEIRCGNAQQFVGGTWVNVSLPKDGDVSDLRTTHHRSYPLTNQQTNDFLAAVYRFATKVANGRYVYHEEGGVKARLSTLPGTRAVNCADFVIKVLREANIASLGYRFKSTPFRVAE